MQQPPELTNPDSSPPAPPVIGLTGSIGSGKSEAALALRNCGAEIIDADLLAREVVTPGSKGLSQIKQAFGAAFITPAGELNRKALGTLVFSDVKAKRELEDILHPLIRDLYLERLAEAKTRKPPLIVYVVPLLFESRFAYPELDAIVVVSAPAESSISRIVARDNCSRDEALRRYSTQIPIAEKAAKADFVLVNDSTLENLHSQAKTLYQKLTKLCPC